MYFSLPLTIGLLRGPYLQLLQHSCELAGQISFIKDYYVYKYLCCLGMRKEWTHSLNFWCLNPAVVSLKICQVTEVLYNQTRLSLCYCDFMTMLRLCF